MNCMSMFKFIFMLVQFQAGKAITPYRQDHVLQETHYLENPVLQLNDHSGAVNEVHFSKDGNFLASVAGELIIWSLDNGKIESMGAVRPHKFPITSCDWNDFGNQIATASADKTVTIQDIQAGKTVRRFKDHKEIVNSVCFLPGDYNIVVSGDDARSLIIHDIRMKDPVLIKPSNSPIISISTYKNLIAVGGIDGEIFINEYVEKKLKLNTRINGDGNMIFGTAFEPRDDGCVAGLTSTGKLTISVMKNSIVSQVHVFDSVKEVVPTRISWSKNGKYIMCGSTDKILRIYDVVDLTNPLLKYELPGHEGSVTGVDFHPIHPIIASCSTDGSVIVGELSG